MRGAGKEKKTVIKTEERCVDGYHYVFKLIRTDSLRVASYGMPLYSVAVSFTDINGEVSEAETKEIFADVGRALSFFNMAVRNLVTPIDLLYAVEDSISC